MFCPQVTGCDGVMIAEGHLSNPDMLAPLASSRPLPPVWDIGEEYTEIVPVLVYTFMFVINVFSYTALFSSFTITNEYAFVFYLFFLFLSCFFFLFRYEH